jgi:hypothetical protein
MKRKHVILVIVTVFIGLFIFSIPTVSSSALYAEPRPSTQKQQLIEDQIKQAILAAVASNKRYVQGGLVADLQVTEIKISQDQQWATAWVVYYDPQIEAVIPSEPGLAVAHFLKDRWQVFLSTDLDWQNAITQLPDDLLPKDEKDMWVTMSQGSVENFTTQSGYLLPWHGGQTGYLSRSVGHDADYTTAHYAFDFYFPGNTVCPSGGTEANSGTTGLNFNVYASKAATVWGWDDSVTDCDHSKVNFIVLQNIDDPTIFQLYMHLSQGSIPPALKSVGAPVARGQFIALADNTGNSTGSHLHFQIERTPNWPPSNPYWNTSLDVTFDDVDINGGRPRVSPADPPYCRPDDICNVFRQTYVSGNYYLGDSTPPIGELTGVITGEIVATNTITLTGWGSDNQSGLDYGQLVADFNGAWHNLGSQFNPDFTYSWDLCNPNLPVPDGPVSVALLLYDLAGNPAPRVGLTHFTKNYSCPIPPPVCIPGLDQVTLFPDPYYQGACVKYNVGNYPTGSSLDPIGNDNAESILVGENALATLYSEENYTGHSQAVISDTAYMQYLWVPSNSLSSMKVSLHADLPQAPSPINPIASTVFREGDVIPFSWLNGGGATEYQGKIYLNSNIYKTLDWQSDPVIYVDSLGQGAYSWQVQGRNTAGESAWSELSTFTIASPIVFPSAETVPYSDTMENTQAKWTRDGLWNYINNAGMAHSGTYSWWYQNNYGDYNDGLPNSGSLTSPPISISSAGYYLRFYYRYQTETTGTNWDQRWLQISVDTGPFINLTQLSDDPQIPETSSWLVNKAIDLSAYSGHIIRIRFQFSTLDASANNYAGWGIDDFSITASPPVTCSENRQDDTPAQAFFLTYDPSIYTPGEICPPGDIDYYKFLGKAGDRIVADVDAMSIGSLLDSYLYLLDTDGKTVLAENDDEVFAKLRDPLIGFTLPKDGIYYLKLKAWKHPLVGGDNYFYTIRLYEDHIKPGVTITWPPPNIYLPNTNMTLTANVDEIKNGVDRVEFYWHSSDWLSGIWELLGTDRDGSNGWSMPFNPISETEGKDGAVYVQVYDFAGNWAGAGAWNLGIDKTAPVTAMNILSPTQPSNAFLLTWSGSDNLSGIDYVEIQEKINGESWTTLPPIDGSLTQYWIIGNPGNTYSFRMHGVDHAGNSENYPADAETTTAIPDANVLCYAPDSYDSSGNNDNTPANASTIYANGASQFHNFCNPLAPNFQNDEDWAKLLVSSGHHYIIHAPPKSPQTATVISLYAQDGTTLLAEFVPKSFGENSTLVWTSDRDAQVYLRFRHLDGRVVGSDVGSTISVKTGTWTFLPVVNRK